MADAPVIKQLPTTVFDKMEFPDYEYREFPMAVPVLAGAIQRSPYDARGKSHPVVIVQNQAEYDALAGGDVEVVPVNAAVVESAGRVKTEEDEREALYVKADQVGAKIDKRWSIERIESAIEAAQAI